MSWSLALLLPAVGGAMDEPAKKESKPAAPKPAQVLPQRAIIPRVVIRPGLNGVSQTSVWPTTYVTDPAVTRRLDEAKQLLAGKETERGLFLLQSVLDNPDVSFVRADKDQWKPASQAAADAILAAGPQVLNRYRQLHEDEAAHLLREADRHHDAGGWGHVARRFFLTKAGGAALDRLASDHLDQGRAAAALYFYDQLLQSPAHADSLTDFIKTKRATALALRDESEPNSADAPINVTLAGKPQSMSEWLEKFRREVRENHDESQSADPSAVNQDVMAGMPLLAADWAVPLTQDKQMREVLASMVDVSVTRKSPLIMGYQPVIIGDTVFMRNFEGLWAMDLANGKVMKKAGGTITSISSELRKPENRFYVQMVQQGGVEYTFLTNQVYGRLSTDGQRVFLTSRVSVNPSPYVPQVINRKPNEEFTNRGRNTLVALDAEGLEPVWEIGTPSDAKGPQAYFFGPPLVLKDKLYVLGESRSELSLFALEAATGKTDWQQVLTVSNRSIESDLFRRTQACQIAEGEGILICPTNLFHLVAIDPRTRLRLWDYSLLDHAQGAPQYLAAAQPMPPPPMANPCDPPIVHSGRVLAWESLGPALHCIDLASGKRLWRVDRAGDWYIGGVHNETVLLIGSVRARGLDLATGKQRWETAITLPSGRGLAHAGHYLLPMASGGLLSLDIRSGTVVKELANRENRPLGTLVEHGSKVLAVSVDGLKAYPLVRDVEKEVERLLAEKPRGASGLYRRAQLHLASSRITDAIADLRAAVRDGADTNHRDQARNLLFSVSANEAARRPQEVGDLVADLETLASTEEERGIHLRLKAEHLLKQGALHQSLEALDAHAALDLKTTIPTDDELVRRSARVWNRLFVERVLQVANASDKEAILSAYEKKVRDAAAAHETKTLRDLSFTLTALPQGTSARLALAEELIRERQLGEAEYVLLEAASGSDPTGATTAFHKLIDLAASSGRPLAAEYFRKEMNQRPPHRGASTESKQADAPAASASWANGKVVATTERTYRPDNNKRLLFPVDPSQPFFSDWTMTFDQQRWELEFQSRKTATVEWKLTNLPKTLAYVQPLNYHQVGSMMVFSQSDTVYAINGMERKLTWHRQFEENDQTINVVTTRGQVRPLGRQAIMYGTGQLIWPQISCVGPGYLVVRAGKMVTVFHPWTNEVLWTRSELRQGQIVAGDGEALVLFESDGTFAAYRMLDGRLLANGSVGGDQRFRKGYYGRRILLFENEGLPLKPRILRMWDPVKKVDYWSKPFSATTEWKMVDNQNAVLLDRGSRLTVLRLEDGSVVLEDVLSAPAAKTSPLGPVGLQIFKDHQRFYIASNQHIPNENVWPVTPSPNLRVVPVHGWLRAYDLTTKKLVWKRDLRNRSIITNPGEELPVLLAVGNRMMDLGQNRKQLATTLDIINKSDGEMLHSEDHSQYGTMLELGYSLAQRWVELRGFNMKIRLEFVEGKKEDNKSASPAPAGWERFIEAMRQARDAKKANSPAAEKKPKL